MHLNKSEHSIITGHLRDLYDHFVTHMSHNRSKRRRVEKKKKKRIHYPIDISRCPVFQHLSHSAKKTRDLNI